MSDKELSVSEGVPERFENPGLPPHRHRMSDTDPAAATRAERQVVGLLLVSILAAIGGVAGYFLFPAGVSLGSSASATRPWGWGWVSGCWGSDWPPSTGPRR